MPAIVVKVDGLRETVRDLERLGVEVDDLKDAFGAIASDAADVARGYTKRRSGRLAGSVRGNRAKNKAVLTFGRSSVPYAGPILYGWYRRNIKAADTVPLTDAVMADRAPYILDRELGAIFDKYAF